MRAADIIAPPFVPRAKACCAALFIARRTTGGDRALLLEACGLLPYPQGNAGKPPKGCGQPIVNYRRPGVQP